MIKHIFSRVDTLLRVFSCIAIFLLGWSISSIWLADWPAFVVGVFATVAAALAVGLYRYYKQTEEAIHVVSDVIGLLTAAIPVAVFLIF